MGLWAHCLIAAAHSSHTVHVTGQAVELQPGQFVYGRGAWASRLGVTEKVLRNLIGTLQKRAMIRASKRASTFTVFEIVNWGTYQQTETEKGQQMGQQKGQHGAISGPHSKNGKNGEKKDISFVEGAPPLRLATYLLSCIRLNRREFKQPDLQAWAKHVDLMIRLDKRDPDHIREIIKWCQSDNTPQEGTGFCWAVNILSTQKLRKQFDQLAIKMNAAQGKAPGASLKIEDILARRAAQ